MRYRVSEIMAAIAADPATRKRDVRTVGGSEAGAARALAAELRRAPISIDLLLARWPTYLRAALGLRAGCTIAGRPLVSDAEVCDALVEAALHYHVPLRRCEPLLRAS